MAINANFNNLVFIKKFNNYFNRKVIGGSSLSSYFPSDQFNEYENLEAFSQNIPDTSFSAIGGGKYAYTLSVLSTLPCGRSAENLTITTTGSTVFTYTYNPVKQEIKIITETQPASGEVFKIVFQYYTYAAEQRDSVNFNENDEILAEVVVNNLSFIPDYMLVINPEDDSIVSRWFVLKTVRNRKMQCICYLRRDVIYDNLPNLMDCPIFVQRGMLPDTDPFIYNDEGMSVNQIKNFQQPLVDGSETAYYVCYIARNTPETTITVGNFSFKISGTRRHPTDAVYDVLIIPYDGTIKDTDSTTFSAYDSEYIATTIAEQLGTQCYDVQLLPYCPLTALASGGMVDLTEDNTLTEDKDFNYITYSGNKRGLILYPKEINFEATLYIGSIGGGIILRSHLTKKESSNLELFRLVSPNFQGAFDFNLGKNGNICGGFRAQCTYKPFTPFIRISPIFTDLYGSAYLDNRGLICGGDFSLTIINSEWVNYQLNNKNYQNIFNREIQNMDFTYSIEKRNQIITGITGIVAGIGAGAAAGAMVGGPWGAVAGAVVGGVASTVGMAIDTYTMEMQYKENRDLAMDKFNYQLGNIKALPYTLTKVGNFDYISAIWPFIERYDCTSKELEAFQNKIKYESMTVQRIDTIAYFYHKYDELKYFKGELIRNEKIAGDNYIFSTIYYELLKGVYL